MHQVKTITLYAGKTGKKIRKATRVILDGGCQVTFMEVVPKKMAIKQALELCAKGFKEEPRKKPH